MTSDRATIGNIVEECMFHSFIHSSISLVIVNLLLLKHLLFTTNL